MCINFQTYSYINRLIVRLNIEHAVLVKGYFKHKPQFGTQFVRCTVLVLFSRMRHAILLFGLRTKIG